MESAKGRLWGKVLQIEKKQVNGSEVALSLAFLMAFMVVSEIRARVAKPGSLSFLWLP